MITYVYIVQPFEDPSEAQIINPDDDELGHIWKLKVIKKTVSHLFDWWF